MGFEHLYKLTKITKNRFVKARYFTDGILNIEYNDQFNCKKHTVVSNLTELTTKYTNNSYEEHHCGT